jgi:hypothetical protein
MKGKFCYIFAKISVENHAFIIPQGTLLHNFPLGKHKGIYSRVLYEDLLCITGPFFARLNPVLKEAI